MTLICPVCETSNEYEEVTKRNERCRQCSSDLGPLRRVAELPMSYYQDGLRLLEEGNVDAAMENLCAAASLDPGSADVRTALAQAYSRKGLHEASLASFEEAVSLVPDRQDIQGMRDKAAQIRHDRDTPAPGAGTQRLSHRPLRWVLLVSTFLLGVIVFAIIQAVPRWLVTSSDLSARVRQRLENHPATRGLRLKVSATDGQVHVAGEVPSELHMQLVRELALQSAEERTDFADLNVNAASSASSAVYRVRPGDSLWLIAFRKYGNAGLWPHIERANQDRLHSSQRLKVGDELLLPPITVEPQ